MRWSDTNGRVRLPKEISADLQETVTMTLAAVGYGLLNAENEWVCFNTALKIVTNDVIFRASLKTKQ